MNWPSTSHYVGDISGDACERGRDGVFFGSTFVGRSSSAGQAVAGDASGCHLAGRARPNLSGALDSERQGWMQHPGRSCLQSDTMAHGGRS